MERILTVSQINGVIKTLLETNAVLRKMTVTGEICDFRQQASSGHLYFSLKDNSGRIRCVMFKSAAAGIDFIPENGLDVIVSGRLSVYEPTGQYQIIVQTMIPAGIGVLYQQFEALKQKLKTMGWFEADAKKPLPSMIRKVGIVTSPSGAAIRDMISVIHRRDPSVEIILSPAQVQGEGAAETIAEGIGRFCRFRNVDVIIIGRGGGSMEDLWCFNDPVVAQAIHDADIPVISAVGHETDYTIADFTADLRAPTPSVAGELVTRDRGEMLRDLALKKDRMMAVIHHRITYEKTGLAYLSSRIALADPGYQIDVCRLDLDRWRNTMIRQMEHRIHEAALDLSVLNRRLKSADSRTVLERGYAMVQDDFGKPISAAQGIMPGDRLKITFSDGNIHVTVDNGSKEMG